MALPIWENDNMLTHCVRSRSWRERLFTLPWRPWVNREYYTLPSTAIYKMHVPPHYKAHHAGYGEGRFVLMCHPVMAARIRTSVRDNARNYVDIVRDATKGTILLDYGSIS